LTLASFDCIWFSILSTGLNIFEYQIQVKNQATKTLGYREGAGERPCPKIMFESTDLRDHSQPYLGLYMSLRVKTPSAETPPSWHGKTEKDLRCAMFGLDPSIYPCLTKEVGEQLKSLLDAHSIKGSEAIRKGLGQVVFMELEAESEEDIDPEMRALRKRKKPRIGALRKAKTSK